MSPDRSGTDRETHTRIAGAGYRRVADGCVWSLSGAGASVSLSPTALRLHVWYQSHDGRADIAKMRQSDFAERWDIPLRTVERAFAQLRAVGAMSTERSTYSTGGKVRRGTNRVTLTMPVTEPSTLLARITKATPDLERALEMPLPESLTAGARSTLVGLIRARAVEGDDAPLPVSTVAAYAHRHRNYVPADLAALEAAGLVTADRASTHGPATYTLTLTADVLADDVLPRRRTVVVNDCAPDAPDAVARPGRPRCRVCGVPFAHGAESTDLVCSECRAARR